MLLPVIHGNVEKRALHYMPWALFLSLVCLMSTKCEENTRKRAYSDSSIASYFSERTCWWNEVCKREFQERFRCRCPRWSFCRSPGRYFDAKCSMSRTGYIWLQGSNVKY